MEGIICLILLFVVVYVILQLPDIIAFVRQVEISKPPPQSQVDNTGTGPPPGDPLMDVIGWGSRLFEAVTSSRKRTAKSSKER
ncbi:MAG: hypothetical protein HY711_05330 [Candidatus Melainabacteria bacterium]|nr:hypothetical protein [Candidatus Melainabacteria bacterium]